MKGKIPDHKGAVQHYNDAKRSHLNTQPKTGFSKAGKVHTHEVKEQAHHVALASVRHQYGEEGYNYVKAKFKKP